MQQANALKVIGHYSYYTSQCLGQGSFGKVYEGFENTTKQRVAIKKIDFKMFEKDSYLEQAIYSEIKIMSKCKHPNIVELYEVLNSKRSLYIIMEYCGEGDLKKYLKAKGRLTEEEATAIMKQVASGFRQLQRMKVIHRDLKPANILISGTVYKLCDFGFAKYVDGVADLLKSCVGSPLYMAPQILERQRYTYKCDVWSFGVIYFELLHGSVPWRGNNELDLLKNVKSIPLRLADCFSPQLVKFIQSLLAQPQDKRATWEDVFAFFEQDKPQTPQSTESPKSAKLASTTLSTAPNEQPYIGLTKEYFEELAFRSFVCSEISGKLSLLNRYNFTRYIFERLLLVLSTSVRYRMARVRNAVDMLQDQTTAKLIKKQAILQQQLYTSLVEQLQQSNCGIDLKKQPDYRMLLDRVIPADAKLYQSTKLAKLALLRTLVSTAVKQLDQQIKDSESDKQKQDLLMVQKNICDMLLINQYTNEREEAPIVKVLKQRKEDIDLSKSISKALDRSAVLKKMKKIGFFDNV